MRTQLQIQGIVLILFGMLLALIAMVFDGVIQLVFLTLALLFGILGLILSLSKDNSDKR